MNNEQLTKNTLTEAVETIKKNSKTKFVGSVNIDIVLNLKEKQKGEVVRGSVTLPHSMGDEKKVIVFCEEKDVAEATKAGADKAGAEDLVKELEGGFNDFDVAIATPSIMPKIAKVAKILGPKGLMPNPKNGTIAQPSELEKTIKSFKAGRMNFKSAPDQGVIRTKVGKVDMETSQIEENVMALLSSVKAESRKLASNPFKKVTLSPTMGAGVKLDMGDIIQKL